MQIRAKFFSTIYVKITCLPLSLSLSASLLIAKQQFKPSLSAFVASNRDVEIESRYEDHNSSSLLLIIFFSRGKIRERKRKFNSGFAVSKGVPAPPAKGLPVVRGSLSLFLSLFSLPLRRRVLLTVTYRLTDLWPGRRPRAGRSQTFCSPLLRGLIALTRSYYIIPTLLIFINLISRARVSFVHSPYLLLASCCCCCYYYDGSKILEKGTLLREFLVFILFSFLSVLVPATVDGVDRVEEVGNVCASEHGLLHRYARGLYAFRGARSG